MQAVAEKALLPLVDFAAPDADQRWQAVNDGVMGGISDGRLRITDNTTLDFFGTLSLENNVASRRPGPSPRSLSSGPATPSSPQSEATVGSTC